MTQFLWAAATGDLVRARQLLARGVNVNASDYDGRTALHLAARGDHSEMCRYLLSVGADPEN